ncbi:Mov34/MPN/PAD-1 family protein [Flavobacterium sp. ACAM 123]|uniref:Mov34/MPN/PAD-1 family protein n=1 Tax=Flavobacterium sp. ACAM 123 TaxID=1189620 RepID=UPI0002D8044D|nr:Mov34/MPN/PAD-1 family protein [Flavobacterium sp. ACAM 123]
MNIKSSHSDICISSEVIDLFKKHVQNKKELPESGGILTGKVLNKVIEIINCSEPSSDDIQSRYNFIRSHKTAQNFINYRFEISNGTEIYLGEWHTHPEGKPKPSNTDLKSFYKTLKKNRLNSDVHFMIIVGIIETYIAIYDKGKMVDQKYIIL